MQYVTAPCHPALTSVLGKITKNPKAQMHWDDKYWTLVVKQYGVLVHGWPHHYAPFQDLSTGTSSR